jgi:hypothetical protein
MYFQWVTREVNTALLNEKYLEKKHDIGILAETIDGFLAADEDWNIYDYTKAIAGVTEYIDGLPMTFAAAYRDEGDGLTPVSGRTASYEASPFDPLSDPEFLIAIKDNENGELTILFEPEGEELREMFVYFKWIPTDPELSNRFLVVAAVSSYSISTPMASWVSIGQWISMGVTFALELMLVILLVRLGHIYEQRDGRQKWRRRID